MLAVAILAAGKGTRMKSSLPKVLQPLGGKSLIEIDPRPGSKDYLDTLIHEALHTIYPDMSETEVHKTTGRLARLIWRQGYRRIQE